MMRHDYPPVTQPEAVYAALAALQVGDRVPPEIYISDYQDEQIPAWSVYALEQQGSRLIVLTLVDADVCIPPTLWEEAALVARQVLTGTKISLATNHYQLLPDSGPRPHLLCDLIQQARYVAKCLQKARNVQKNA